MGLCLIDCSKSQLERLNHAVPPRYLLAEPSIVVKAITVLADGWSMPDGKGMEKVCPTNMAASTKAGWFLDFCCCYWSDACY